MSGPPNDRSSRQLIVQEGLRILHEEGLSVGMARVRLRRAAADAYLTTGAAYNIWDGQADFHRDLAVAAVLWSDRGPLDETLAAVREAVRDEVPWPEVVRLASRAHVHDPQQDRGYLISLALRATAGDDEDVRAASRARHEDSVGQFAQFIDHLLDRYYRRMRAPFTTIDLVTALGALSEGFSVHTLSGLEHPRYTVEGREWTLYAVSTLALCEHFTEPSGHAAEDEGGGEPAGDAPDNHTSSPAGKTDRRIHN